MPLAINAPTEWKSLEDFAAWYVASGFPMMPPSDFQTFRTDDAVAICTFRRPPYQVELYVIDDPLSVPMHEHPYVEVLQYVFDRGGPAGSMARPRQFGSKLSHGMAHGDFDPSRRVLDANGVIYTFEKWPDGVMPSTISAVWKGNVVGPRHEALIKSFFPGAYVRDGFADVTRKM